MKYTVIDSPVGPLLTARDVEGIRLIRLPEPDGTAGTPKDSWTRDDAAFDDLRGQLDEYFDGTRRDFDLPLSPVGTEFQLAAWHALTDIPYGETVSYGKQAAAIGKPSAVRAIGAANGANPLPIVVPCHRVIGADGSLTGYGGGIECKRWLLAHEAQVVRATPRQYVL